MHVYKIIFFLLFLLPSSVFAQNQIIIDQNWDHTFIENQCMIFKMTSETQWEDKAIFSGKNDHLFTAFTTDLIKGKETFNWIKFNLKNVSEKDVNLYIGTSRFEKMILYSKMDSTTNFEGISGTLVSNDNKQVKIDGLSFFNVKLPKGQTTFYIKTINKNAPITPQLVVPFIISNETFYKNNYENNSSYTLIFLGAIGIMLLYNILLFITTRQKAFFYYAGYVVFVAIFALGIIPQFAHRLYGHMDINQFPISTAGTLSTIFYIIFAAEIMETKKYFPKAYKFLMLLIIMLGIGLLSFIKPLMLISSTMNFLAAFLMSPALLTLGLLMMIKKHTPGTFFFIGNVIFMIAQLVLLFTFTNIIPPINFGFSGISIYQLGILIQLALFSLGIASKINEVKEINHQKELERMKANQLASENEEIKFQREKAEKALYELTIAQTQLIQSEKLASLGELTAGIAHEIQNPLNFVNNFSEVSTELIDEMNEQISKGDLEEAQQIANDLKVNMEKINHHGKRADSIVKGMLYHSRASSGQKEAVDINKLCDEYLRLAYHGLRAKDKSFNANFDIIPQENMPLVHVIPQDIGRVILNIITNAFHAVHEKKIKLGDTSDYKPTVILKTRAENNQCIIEIEDNGNGIASNIIDKIFQPFFTTKPTGKGTGLGLSMAYDIVTKGHGGELKAKSKGTEGTVFQVNLPISN